MAQINSGLPEPRFPIVFVSLSGKSKPANLKQVADVTEPRILRDALTPDRESTRTQTPAGWASLDEVFDQENSGYANSNKPSYGFLVARDTRRRTCVRAVLR